MSIYERITNLCKEQGKTITQLEAESGLSQRTIGRWNNNKPAVDKVAKVASALGTTIDYLVTGEKKPPPGIAENYVTFAILGEVAAGYEFVASQSWDNGNVDIPESWLRGKSKEDYFVLEVRGDSMYPHYQDGDLVLVLRQEVADYSGQIVVALYDDENATVKKLEYDYQRTWVRLTPINPQYPSKTIRGEDLDHFRILGIPKKLIRNIET